MAMTKAGIIKRRENYIKKYGSYQEYCNFMKSIGSTGGYTKTEKTKYRGYGKKKLDNSSHRSKNRINIPEAKSTRTK